MLSPSSCATLLFLLYSQSPFSFLYEPSVVSASCSFYVFLLRNFPYKGISSEVSCICFREKMAANDVPCCETMFWVYLIICVALVCFAGLMSGLTLGLMSLSLVDLEVLSKSGQPKDRRNAEKILPLVKNQHLLLCTLLIYNAMAMEALPIFLDALLPAWASILISVTLILAFGEIIPQSICSQYGLSVGAKLSVLVRVLVILLLPISYPISKLLDWLLGRGHSALLRRSELKTFVDLHANEAGKGGELTQDETTIIGGALDLTTKTAKDAMTDMSKVFSLDVDAKLDKDTMELIMREGHSRVPIYSGCPSNIIGLILVKNLVVCRPEDETPIRNLTIRKISRFYDHLPLYDILNLFQMGHSHMGIVVRKQGVKDMSDATSNSAISVMKTNAISRPEQSGKKSLPMLDAMELGKNVILHHEDTILQVPDLDSCPDPSEEVIGIITMEDVLEELLQEEIFDETDDYVDVHNRIRINMLPVIRSAPRSAGATPVSHLSQSPVASPFSSYHNTPILQSPTQAFIPSPLIRPSLLSSPMRSRLPSPSTNSGSPMRTSPLRQVATNSYEKLRR
uniref:CNNM transmembrane domain-containing protein n=1 Tax=Chenopodium quinoa TaxID=63459 RepID=A0A803M060_CHEQI